jgi:hypothetical protein
VPSAPEAAGVRVWEVISRGRGHDGVPAAGERCCCLSSCPQSFPLEPQLAGATGQRWNYANNDTLLLSYALRLCVRDDRVHLAYPYEKLFRRIGMRHTTAETDWGGTFTLSSQVWTTARDLTRFGLLLLNDGGWSTAEILPPGWVRYMGTPAPAQPPAKRADGKQNAGYGAQIWLYGKRHGLPAGLSRHKETAGNMSRRRSCARRCRGQARLRWRRRPLCDRHVRRGRAEGTRVIVRNAQRDSRWQAPACGSGVPDHWVLRRLRD